MYHLLLKAEVSLESLIESTKLDRIKKDDGIDPQYVLDILAFCLMSDDQLQALREKARRTGDSDRGPWVVGQRLLRVSSKRDRVIPFLCKRLDQFSVTPKTTG